MEAPDGLRWWRRLVVSAALVTVALPTGAAAAQAPGLPRTYNAQTIDSPDPRGGGSFGWGLASADLNGDGKLDLLVPQAQDPTSSQIFIFDGADGHLIDTIKPPELNPDANPDPTIGFVYVETMPDIGSCPGGDGPDADKICDLPLIGPPDGIPEILVGARGLRVNATNGAIPPTTADRQIGRGYVIDGATRAVLKRIDMPQADRMQQFNLGAPAVAPQFGRVMSSPQALPPCAGLASEDNNQGVGPCPDMPVRSRIGDLDGGGKPDIVITAPERDERRPDAGPLHVRQGLGLPRRGHRRHRPARDPRHAALHDQEPARADRRAGVRRQPLPRRRRQQRVRDLRRDAGRPDLRARVRHPGPQPELPVREPDRRVQRRRRGVPHQRGERTGAADGGRPGRDLES
jgi:hypothetical protein